MSWYNKVCEICGKKDDLHMDCILYFYKRSVSPFLCRDCYVKSNKEKGTILLRKTARLYYAWYV